MRLVDFLLLKDPKLRPQAARTPTLPLSELQMPNFVVENYDDGEKIEGQYKSGELNRFDTNYWPDGAKCVKRLEGCQRI